MALLHARSLSADADIQIVFGVLATLIAFLTLLVAMKAAFKCYKLRRAALLRRLSSDLPLHTLSPAPTQTTRMPFLIEQERSHDYSQLPCHWPRYPPRHLYTEVHVAFSRYQISIPAIHRDIVDHS